MKSPPSCVLSVLLPPGVFSSTGPEHRGSTMGPSFPLPPAPAPSLPHRALTEKAPLEIPFALLWCALLFHTTAVQHWRSFLLSQGNSCSVLVNTSQLPSSQDTLLLSKLTHLTPFIAGQSTLPAAILMFWLPLLLSHCTLYFHNEAPSVMLHVEPDPAFTQRCELRWGLHTDGNICPL